MRNRNIFSEIQRNSLLGKAIWKRNITIFIIQPSTPMNLDFVRTAALSNDLSEGYSNASERTEQRTRYSQLTSFFNFITQNLDPNFRSPCDTPMLKKLYRSPGVTRWTILEKEVVDEVIFRTIKPRNWLMLELMARGGMRISEVLKLTPRDIEDRKLILRSPKSGKEREVVFIPQKVADRLREYINAKGLGSDQRIFPIS
jgi:integrase